MDERPVCSGQLRAQAGDSQASPMNGGYWDTGFPVVSTATQDRQVPGLLDHAATK